MTTTEGKKWYVLRTLSGKEKKVKQYIETEIKRNNLGNYISQVLIPTMKEVTFNKAGKKITREKNPLPGYILIEAELTGEVPHIIESVNGVISFLGPKGQQPEALRPAEVNRLLGKMDELADAEEIIQIPYQVGDAVKVTDGPFNSFSGVIEEVNEEKKKLKVMVKIFGRRTPLELSYVQVEKE
ncbi:MAG: transcription termination/antitermination protein NusG [Bacteroidia bacterium]|nr:transcription termination/antitermination factor NusG [Bacteroidia bacterium]MCZ2277019.1 transcription termination/antitermination protein NusG [Bacteroidia bacterium]